MYAQIVRGTTDISKFQDLISLVDEWYRDFGVSNTPGLEKVFIIENIVVDGSFEILVLFSNENDLTAFSRTAEAFDFFSRARPLAWGDLECTGARIRTIGEN